MNRRHLIFAAVSILLLGALNGLIYEKEALLDRGQTVFVKLAPEDPRSLIQGDYMRLDYELSNRIRLKRFGRDDKSRQGRIVVELDENRVAHFKRLYKGGPLEKNERLLKWKYRDGIYVGSNAYYFQEGNADLYDDAEYAELKVDDSGESILVGLRDDDLHPLGPGKHPGRRPPSPRPVPKSPSKTCCCKRM